MITVADTSGIIAASDRNAPESAACRAFLQEAGTVIISPMVLTEVDRLAKARFGSQALDRDHRFRPRPSRAIPFPDPGNQP